MGDTEKKINRVGGSNEGRTTEAWTVMVDFTRELDRTTGCPDIWLKITQGVFR